MRSRAARVRGVLERVRDWEIATVRDGMVDGEEWWVKVIVAR